MTLVISLIAAMAVQAQAEIVDLAGQPDRAQIEAWRTAGVEKIITLQTGEEVDQIDFDLAETIAAQGVVHARVPTTSQSGPMTADQLAAVLADTDGRAVIHCRSGTRARHLYAAALIRSGKLDAQDYRSVDPDADWNEDLLARFTGADLD